jgi:tetraacyldisaccharide 4'-kinase
MISKLASGLYGSLVRRRNNYFDRTASKIKLPIPVFSIGNLSVGGTGKTPFCISLAKYLLENGNKPAVVGKAYKAKANYDLVVSDGKKIFAPAEVAGDEMFLIASKLPVPVVVAKEKNRAAQIAMDRFNINCVLVDDGFQHRQLARDIDIVILDKESIDNPKLMPEGRLREPLDSLKRADVVCLPENLELNLDAKRYINPNSEIVKFSIIPDTPYSLHSGKALSDEEIRQAKNGSIAVSGIAKPQKFEEMLKKTGVNIKDSIHFSDHHKYDWKDLDGILRKSFSAGTNAIAVTEKDAVKLKKYSDELIKRDLYVFVYPIQLKIIEGEDSFKEKVNNIFDEYRI